MAATLRGYREAVGWAGRRGVLGIAFDHGNQGQVQLAPGGYLEANRGFLQDVYRIREGQSHVTEWAKSTMSSSASARC